MCCPTMCEFGDVVGDALSSGVSLVWVHGRIIAGKVGSLGTCEITYTNTMNIDARMKVVSRDISLIDRFHRRKLPAGRWVVVFLIILCLTGVGTFVKGSHFKACSREGTPQR